jgi:hypothetical protein
MRMLLAEDKPAGVHSSRRSMPKRVHGARFNVSKGARQCEKEQELWTTISFFSVMGDGDDVKFDFSRNTTLQLCPTKSKNWQHFKRSLTSK